MTEQRRGVGRRAWRSRLLRAVTLGVALACGPGLALAAEAEVPTGIAALGFNLPGLIAQLINFAILLVVMRMFLYKPVLKILDERKTRIEEGLNRAEQAAAQASASQDEARRVIEEARGQGRELVASAQEAAARLRAELEERARIDSAGIVSRARDEIKNERDQAIEQLRREFTDLALAAAERVIGQSLDRAAHQRLIDETLVNSDLGRRN
ncbi:MAG: ATP synthase F0 subunit B [Dehalococcoidia bacterium]|nr:ATP synthase F0 subunit B [Dehalococcoidia bacterium]